MRVRRDAGGIPTAPLLGEWLLASATSRAGWLASVFQQIRHLWGLEPDQGVHKATPVISHLVDCLRLPSIWSSSLGAPAPPPTKKIIHSGPKLLRCTKTRDIPGSTDRHRSSKACSHGVRVSAALSSARPHSLVTHVVPLATSKRGEDEGLEIPDQGIETPG